MTEQTAYLFISPSSHPAFIPTQPIPTHLLTLWESDRASWELLSLSADRTASSVPRRWIPRGPDHIMCDGLLMIASLVIKDKTIRENLEAASVNMASDLVELTDYELTPDEEKYLPLTSEGFNIIVCVLAGSSLGSQLAVLSDLSGNVDILRSTHQGVIY